MRLPHLALLTPLLLTQPPWHPTPYTRPTTTPILTPNLSTTFLDPLTHTPVHWQANATFNPAAILHNGQITLLYRAEDDSGITGIGQHTSRLGLATSQDGIHFTPLPTPVFYPDHDSEQSRETPGGVEDPRLVESPASVPQANRYILTYTQWSRTAGIYRIGIATSPDLVHWQKHGPAFPLTGPYAALKYKSAGIITRVQGGRLVAANFGQPGHSLYYMYWGEIEIHLATSPDLIHWTPVEDAPGHPRTLLAARPHLFDSGFPETGPPALLTRQGILLLYNAKNSSDPAQADPHLGPGAYSVQQALFSAADPSQLLRRTTQPVLAPALPWEKSGQYAAGTTFAEGLVLFHGKLWLYYGSADSFVGVATAPAPAF